ncbi:DoxX family protein [Arenibaculum pallidiluteum]|uniref:DoxX family protein n=1 Tax=Arenibaculum pallidiluteum TaxID=2812559 RepID=UPI001A96BB9A|nr:DoxX family protein [Arenibaculum pallidiluteum]
MSFASLTRQVDDRFANPVLSNAVPALGRLLIAAIFLLSGASKVMDPATTIGYIAAVGLPLPEIAYILAVLAEVGGGIALVLGFQARLVALALAGFSIVTALVFHSALGELDQFIHFFKNIAMAGGLLQIVAFGAGRFSVDGLRR